MDDDRFPRSGRLDDDDLLVRSEAVGDHDIGAEDRQLLLDAVMAAGEHLLITYSGHDELTSHVYPPAVPIAELIDTVTDMVGDEAMGSVVIPHPLQSFSERNFVPGELGVPGPWGYDEMQLAGAVAARQRRAAPGVPVPSPPAPTDWPDIAPQQVIPLDDLIAFLHHPAGRFVRTRLKFSVPELGELADDALEADLGGLAAWAVKDRLLSGLIAGHDLDALAARERHSDALPPGELGSDDLAESMEVARGLWDAARQRGYDPQRQRPWTGAVRLGDRLVEGTVLADADHAQIVTVTPSRLRARRRLRSFVELVFISAIEPGIAWEATLLGRGPGDGHQAVTIGPIGDGVAERKARAEQLLTDLVDLYDAGHRQPLAIPCETAYAWQRHARNDRRRAFGEARSAWEDGYQPERADGAHTMVLPQIAAVADLLASGFEDYCNRLWGPILPLMRERRL
jgi:exodeoxyribonuclease V gamma subunit